LNRSGLILLIWSRQLEKSSLLTLTFSDTDQVAPHPNVNCNIHETLALMMNQDTEKTRKSLSTFFEKNTRVSVLKN